MLTEQLRRELDWEKTDGLMPVIVQHAVSGEVLMLGLSLIHIYSTPMVSALTLYMPYVGGQ